MSWRSWLKLAQWTVFGTAGCLAVSLTYNYFAFRHFEPEIMWKTMVSATVLPVVLAGPLFFYLTLKLRELAAVNRRLAVVASTDSLTSCLNRGAFTRAVDERLADPRWKTSRSRGALIVIDADHFKAINDGFGHDQGDEALRIISSAIRGSVRGGDIVGRLGGEEFGVFLPDITRQAAEQICERIRFAVEQAEFLPLGRRHPLSVSVGAVLFGDQSGFTDIFRIADQRLYSAKSSGRNRVDIADVSRAALRPGHLAALH